MSRLATVVLCLAPFAAVVPGASAGAATEPASPPTRPVGVIEWGPCDDELLREAGAECGHLDVPLDHDRPAGATVSLALSRVKHTVPDDQYQGVMITNPGGPGSSGLTVSLIGELVLDDVGDAYDWIGFDPRGLGETTPALSCDPTFFDGPRPPYTPTSAAVEREWLVRSQQYAADCARNGGELLSNMRTEDTARDIDLIRQALGQEQINYFGFSYGTYLGQIYATMYPERVRRMVLDSAVDSEKVWDELVLSQGAAFDRNLNLFFDWVAKYDETYDLGSTGAEVRRRWYTEQDRLAAGPAGGEIGPAEWADVFVSVAYFQPGWPNLAEVFAAWANGRDAAGLIEEYSYDTSASAENGYAVYNAVQCTDAPGPRSWSQWRAAAAEVAETAPSFAWRTAWHTSPCLWWPAPVEKPVEVDGSSAPPILMTVETLDAATPYDQSLAVRAEFPEARLIAVEGGTTHSYSLEEEPCVTQPIADYLATGAVPERQPGQGPDVRCDPLPEPTPNPQRSP
ncbi:MAG: alpha/beta fold hydrolase [Dermatophilaceae bacterium]